MNTILRLTYKTFLVSIIVFALGVLTSTQVQAGWLNYLFGNSNTFTQFNILTPGAGGIYAAAAPGYIYTHGLDVFGNSPYGGRADIYNLGYLSSISRSHIYNSSYGYPNVFSGLGGLLGIGP